MARVNGSCVAGGTGFMLACDIVIASSKAKFGTPEVNVGLFPMMIGALIFRNVLKKKAMEMVLLGEKLSAEQALEMGMITRVVAPEDLDTGSGKGSWGVGEKKPHWHEDRQSKLFMLPLTCLLKQALDFLAEKIAEVAATQDAIEGITAFIEKREPVFTGK